MLVFVILLVGCTQNQFPISEKDCVDLEGESKDFCYAKLAIIQSDVSFCLKVENINNKDLCYMRFAAWYEDVTHCNNVDVDSQRDYCFFGIAMQTSDVSICQSIPEDTISIGTRDICKVVSSIKNTKENIRDDSMLYDKNMMSVVYMTSDEIDKVFYEELEKAGTLKPAQESHKKIMTLMDQLEQTCDSQATEDDVVHCFISFAIKNENTDVCDLLNEDNKYTCYHLVAAKNNNVEICNRIKDKGGCIAFVAWERQDSNLCNEDQETAERCLYVYNLYVQETSK